MSEKTALIESHESAIYQNQIQEQSMSKLNTELQNKLLHTKQQSQLQLMKETIEKRTKQLQQIQEYVQTFNMVNGRKPHSDEITDHFTNGDEEIDMNIIQTFLATYSLDETHIDIVSTLSINGFGIQ